MGFSRVRHINNCLIESFDYARIANLRKSKSYKLRLSEDKPLDSLARRTEKDFSRWPQVPTILFQMILKSFLDIWKMNQ